MPPQSTRPSRASRAPRAPWALKSSGKSGLACLQHKKGPPRGEGRSAIEPVEARQRANALLRRGWREHFPLATGFWFSLRFRRFLGFFSAFVFASHGSNHDTKPGRTKSPNRSAPFRVLSPFLGGSSILPYCLSSSDF